ncbi:glycoside hydrolase family 15 protein [Rhodopila sp.]|uniref:glycoside hydrolase family 15 protein n=1 Tax=Rhodopila sp. TaxID=2480087 RepID=UPI003D1184A7
MRYGIEADSDLALMPNTSGADLALADDFACYPPIADYAVVGDCRTLALISRQGSVDWLCLPDTSGPSVFAALLDRRNGGRFALRPTAPFRTERRYLARTNVLETTFITASGRVRVTDLMTLNSADGRGLQAERELLRVAEGIEGEVELEALYDPRPDYARARPRLVNRGAALGWMFQHDGQAFCLLAELDMRPAGVAVAVGLTGRVRLRRGERRRLSLSHATRDMLVIPPMGAAADHRLDRTAQWWRDWSAQCTFNGRHRAMALRSALALKLLTYGLSGAVLAAATTSLPEAIGGVRNYDYRFCWLRDAATTLRAFTDLGFRNEGRAYLEWLLHSTRLTRPRLVVMYDEYGRTLRSLRELSHLEGYRGSSPVRIGNDATGQLQHDVYGSAIAAAVAYVECGGTLAADEQRLLIGFGRQVCASWRQPDNGLWEVPGARRHYVHSKLMCWSALDALLRLDDMGHLRAPLQDFLREREAVREAIETLGYITAADGGGSYVGAFGEDWVDASLLIMARLGFHDPHHPRIVETEKRIWRELGRDGLLLRYLPEIDGLESHEGAFGICGFWAVELLTLQGRIEEAEALFHRAASLANDVGLLAEEYNPSSGAALGNVPQAFTHAGLISAALMLAQAGKTAAGKETRS